MAEQDRAPLIRLPIDQEIYMDSVLEGTLVEDATVATEVVSFERVGDAYVLEGAIVFAGYVSHGTDKSKDVASEEGQVAEHFHHRLPFVLRVPIQPQPRGILNVKSRLSGWQLSVAGRGWLRVQGDLQVAGLTGDDGYHFECGGQQLGHPLFDMKSQRALDEEEIDPTETAGVYPPDRSVNQSDSIDAHMPSKSQGAEPGSELPKEPALFRSASMKDVIAEAIERISEARTGHGLESDKEHRELTAGDWDAEPTREVVDGVDQRTEIQNVHSEQDEVSEIRAIDELANFDRFFSDDKPHEGLGRVASAASPLERHEESHLEKANGAAQKKLKTVAEFEFEHQLNPEEMTKLEQQASLAKAEDEAFAASRSFVDDGFHAASGFIRPFRPDEVLGLQTESLPELPDERLEAMGESDCDDSESKRLRDESEEKLWSFVDFNAPERKYTLRYVIVLEEETLETIADRLRCTKSELMRVNKLEWENVAPGQTLLTPDVPFSVSK